MNTTEQDDIEIDLWDLIGFLRSKIWFIIICGLLAASIAGLFSKFLITPIYSSTTKLYIVNKSTSLSSLSLSDLQLGTQLTKDYMVLVESRPVTEQVIENLGLDMEYEELLNILTISNPADTRILEISVDYPDAFIAKEIVDEFAAVSSKRIATIMDIKEPAVVESGHTAVKPTSPHVMKNTVIGALIGLFISTIIFGVMYLMDDTIKSSEDIEQYLGLNTIGLIPLEEGEEAGTMNAMRKKKQTRKRN